MKQITDLNQIKNTGTKIYVRWSKSFAMDQKRGYSLRCGSSREVGLSCCEIDPTWEDWCILRQIHEYFFCGGACWIITGDKVGTGGDDEPLLNNIKLVGKVSKKLLAQSENWRKMELVADIADAEDRLTRMTDEIAIRQTMATIAKYSAEYAKL
ncbi:MAG: DUF6098 family protein [Phycisphaerae bacterium]|jgi:hypothetical protein